MSYHNPDLIPALAERLLELLERMAPNIPAAIGGLALALAVALREMDSQYSAPKGIVELADDLEALAGDASVVVQRHGTTIQ